MKKKKKKKKKRKKKRKKDGIRERSEVVGKNRRVRQKI